MYVNKILFEKIQEMKGNAFLNVSG